MAKYGDLVGQRFGRLVVLTVYGRKKNRVLWECRCDCGNTIKVSTGNLTRGITRSCGCLHHDIVCKYENDIKCRTIEEFIDKWFHITKDGRVISRPDGKVLTATKDRKGYLRVRLACGKFSTAKDGRKGFRIHRLVARKYLTDYSEELQVNHKNGIKTDNRVENLEMVTCGENVAHSWKMKEAREARLKKLRAVYIRKDKYKWYMKQGRRIVKIFNSRIEASEFFTKDDIQKTRNMKNISRATKVGCRALGYYWEKRLKTQEELAL